MVTFCSFAQFARTEQFGTPVVHGMIYAEYVRRLAGGGWTPTFMRMRVGEKQRKCAARGLTFAEMIVQPLGWHA